MGSSSGLAGLKCLQWVFRGVQFICSVVVLGIYSYYLATLISHSMTVPTDVKAVEGISAIGTLYTTLGLLLVCCCAGHLVSSFIAIVADVGLIGAYVYVAVANRVGAGSCAGSNVDTVYGSGDATATPSGSTGDSVTNVARLPTFQVACRMETACLVASCIAILFFILSVFMEISMNRNRHRANRPIRDADGEYMSKSDHYGAPPQRRYGSRRGLLGVFRRHDGAGFRGAPMDPDVLPTHQQPGDMQTRQVEAWGEVASLHDSDRLYFNEAGSPDEHGLPVRIKSTTAPRPAADSYNEGDVGDREYDLYRADEPDKDHSETGQRKKQRETKAARIERLEAA